MSLRESLGGVPMFGRLISLTTKRNKWSSKMPGPWLAEQSQKGRRSGVWTVSLEFRLLHRWPLYPFRDMREVAVIRIQHIYFGQLSSHARFVIAYIVASSCPQ